MSERKLIHVFVTFNRKEYAKVAIPADINEVELKACLRDLGYIASYRLSYLNTKVYLEDEKQDALKQICTEEYRSLEDLGISEKSLIVIEEGEPEPNSEAKVIRKENNCKPNSKVIVIGKRNNLEPKSESNIKPKESIFFPSDEIIHDRIRDGAFYSDSMRVLYGCPMAQSVEEAVSQAEMYSDDDSLVTTGTIGLD